MSTLDADDYYCDVHIIFRWFHELMENPSLKCRQNKLSIIHNVLETIV